MAQEDDTKRITELEKLVSDLKKSNKSLKIGIQTLEGEAQALKKINAFLINEKAQWAVQKEIQERVIQEALNRSNALNQVHQEEIQRLREKIKSNGNHNVVVHSGG